MKQTNIDTFKLSIKEIEEINTEIKYYENPKAVLIEALKIIQKYRGWVENKAIHAIADLLKINASEVESVATFYSQIYRQPVGRNIIKYCDSYVCYMTGYKKNEIEINNLLKISTGETTVDKKFTLLNTCCLGNCDKGPSMMINNHTYCNVKPYDIKNILEKYK